MLKIEIDGRQLEVPFGSTVMDATNQLGIYVPHFCYHSKLSIAANCRMCLVEVEKAPKPLPACATPVTDGMKVKTFSPVAKQAQNGVMEFLLINHPLDCPICDQGGECQLQDLAVGYGKGASRYQEEKRVVPAKDIGPLVAAEEMSRCIQCTRCVRFGQEIAGVMELGMVGRGEHAEIVAFVGKTVDSELSGNMIDLCPVGALTSKPFRYSARTWELARRKSVSPHDGLGSNLVVQVNQNQGDARSAARERGDQRMLAFGQGPVLLRGPELPGAPHAADAQARRAVGSRGLAGRPRIRDGRAAAHQGRAWRVGHRRARHAALDAGGTEPAGPAGARPGQRERRFSPAPVRFFGRRQARRGALARHADRRVEQTGPGAGDRFVPAQGPSADCAAAAPDRQAARADQYPALGRRRSADADREPADRASVGNSRGAGLDHGGRIGPGGGDPREPQVWRETRRSCSAISPSSIRRPRRSMRLRRPWRRPPAQRWVFSARRPTASAAISRTACPAARKPRAD